MSEKKDRKKRNFKFETLQLHVGQEQRSEERRVGKECRL